MLQLRQYLCNLIGKPVTTTQFPQFPRIGLGNRVLDADVLQKDGLAVMRKTSFISDAFFNILQCNEFNPPPANKNTCVINTDCSPGQQCKEGTCLSNPANCVNAGCSTNYECNTSTGTCDFVPQCHNDTECNQIDNGERCLGNICLKPSICIPSVNGMCAPTWSCVDRKCVKS